MAGDTERRTIRLPKTQWRVLEGICRQEGSTLSALLESVLDGFIIGTTGKALIDEEPAVAAAYATIEAAVMREAEERLRNEDREE